MIKHSLLLLFFIFSFSLAANQIVVSDFTVREFIPGTTSSVGYLTLSNNTDKQEVLTSVEIQGIGRVEIHNHLQQNGMMRMVHIQDLKIMANTTVSFQSGGLHLMLFEPNKKLIKGEKVHVTFHFASGLKLAAMADVVGLSVEKEDAHQHHHHH